MISLFRKICNDDEIIKHKIRIEYFFILIPSMFIMIGYLFNSIKFKDCTFCYLNVVSYLS